VPAPSGPTVTTWTPVAGQRVRALEVLPGVQPWGLVCVLPGLSLTGYLVPAARALAARGLRCAVLDLPGLGRPARSAAAGPLPAGELAARWLEDQPRAGPLVLIGHSTGAAAAIRAATASPVAPALLVLAGPVFAPEHRRLRSLLTVTPRAYARESLRELVPASRLAAHPLRVGSIVRAGVRTRPEDLIGAVSAPLLLTAGEADALAPAEWLVHLARSACSAASVHWTRLPGSHNNLFTHPEEFADLVLQSVRARGRRARE